MSKPAVITSPSGDRLVVIPLEEYERLAEAAEDAADVRAYDTAKGRIAAGEDEGIPIEFANRILDGENKVRVWREFRGMTVKDLAAAAGITAAYLSQIETGTRDGSVATFKKIAAALNVSIDDIA